MAWHTLLLNPAGLAQPCEVEPTARYRKVAVLMGETAVTKIACGALAAVLAATSLSAADKIDPRLATVRKAFVVAVDELDADWPVAICFAERLSRATPIESVKTKAAADVVFRITAHITNGKEGPTNRPTTTADIVAELPDGTRLWSEKNYHGRAHGQGVECLLADDLLNTLRDAMKKSRDQK